MGGDRSGDATIYGRARVNGDEQGFRIQGSLAPDRSHQLAGVLGEAADQIA